ncbi:hypothetical protein [Phytoactinopolyspora halophila]|uniref:hypothetical protein n=1 Tax=Phytoactinopolyspora halophila TaxID=1981511 RepID=UPI0013DDB78E|nr:hypothetical protein [Phytoactinopolyspora halophila]
MYAFVWRQLPGPWPAKLILSLVLFAVIVYALFMWIFPWAEETLGITQVTVD